MTLHTITDKIAKAEAAAGRPAGSVSLIAVSKVQPDERVETAFLAKTKCRKRQANGLPSANTLTG